MALPVLTRSKDRKVTNAVTRGVAPAIANSFGLPAGKQFSCTDQTDYCGTICYAGKLEKIYRGVSAVLTRNFDALRDATRDEMISMLTVMIDDFRRDCTKRGAEPLFRIHWDGDFFSPVYVTAWHAVIAATPDVRYWVYTRVPTAATYLHAQRLPNLALYFSGDRDNIRVARHLATQGIRVAYVGPTFDEAREAVPGAVRCPENNGSIPLITGEGSACARCGLCIRGKRDVLFSASKR